jgi:hypothetical protein
MKYLAGSALVVLTAVACHSDHGYTSGPSALIVDGSQGGNPFFYWLPPLMPQLAPSGQTFSAQLNPTVTITNLCTGNVIRSFAGADVHVGEGQFHANWHTPDDSLDPACDYRITVQTGARQLGFADVDVVDSGRELKNVNTNEYLSLLDDRTLPIKFFIGVGSQCERMDSDCGEGTAQPGANTTIVTVNGQAGVLIPAGAVDQPVTITLESSDERPCIAGLAEPVFPGDVGAVGNSCYDIHTDPPLAEVNASGKFNTSVTVGICAATSDLDHATRDLLQIFQLHVGANPPIRALNNVPAPFLRCDPGYLLGARRSVFGRLAAKLGAMLLPRPLSANARTAFDVGAGGSADNFSRFSWALPSQIDLNFDQAPDIGALLPGAVVNSAYRRLGVTFSRTNPLGICPGTSVYANDYGLLGTGLLGFNSGQNNISPCPLGIASDFSEYLSGDITATFALPAVQACINATPTGYHTIFPGGVAFLEGLDESGNLLNRTESSSERVPQQLCVSGTGIAAVRFAGKGAAYAIFDNLRWTRVLPTP